MSLSAFLALRARVHGTDMKPKFTSGPYHVSGSGPRMRSIKSAGGRTIAQVLFSEKRERECEATARLLAAAPDLLLQLRLLLIACPCGQHWDGIEFDGGNERYGCERCASALSAIAKAEGI